MVVISARVQVERGEVAVRASWKMVEEVWD